jgi:hypothetical protein
LILSNRLALSSAIANVCRAGKEDGNGAASTAESLSTYETQPPIASTKQSSEATTNETQESVVSTDPNLLQTGDTGSLW